MKKVLVIILLCSSPSLITAQKEGNIWLFGDSSGVDFNVIPPTAIISGITYTHENSSSICDKDGHLHFYTSSVNPISYNKIAIWNNSNIIVQNGDGLFGHSSVTQGTLLLPSPQDDHLTYLFHIFPPNGLYYSVVDDRGDSGNGLVDLKNELLFSGSLVEKMLAVRHANGRDWWLIVHNVDDEFIIYLVEQGVISGPYEQSIGSVHGSTGIMGQMCISPDGSKLACVNVKGIIDVFDFDRCSGTLSNWIALGNSTSDFYGCSISYDNSKLYVSTLEPDYYLNSFLYQFDLLATDIISSKFQVYRIQNPYCFGQHQTGIDSKIYIAKASGISFPNNVHDTNNMFLSIIEQTNLSGYSCQFNLNGLYLGGRKTEMGLPNIPNYALGAITGSMCDTIPEPEDTTVATLVYIPNVFSPNGDGNNDVWGVRTENPCIVSLKIFDRWGICIFETSSANVEWDGKYKGKDCPDGVYFYLAEIHFLNGESSMRNGNITLVR